MKTMRILNLNKRSAGISPSINLSQLSLSAQKEARVGDESCGSCEMKDLPRSDNSILWLSILALLFLPLILPMLLMPWDVHWMLPGWAQLVLTLPIQFGFGARFYRSAWDALRSRSTNMDVLIVLGTTAAFGLSGYHLMTGRGPLYFESSAAIITFVLLGKSLEARARRATRSAVESLREIQARTANVLRDGAEITVDTQDLRVNERVLVRPGERIPVDGLIVQGISQIDEALLNGEAVPATKGVGSNVTGGSINIDGVIIVEVRALEQESILAQMIRHIEHSQATQVPIQNVVDRISAIFVPTILVTAVVTWICWGLWSDDWVMALIRSISVLVVACPCALGLATPTALVVGIGKAARAGILFKEARSLEATASISLIVFDKTGTLTQGRPAVTEVVAPGMNRDDLLRLAASVLAGSDHPFARAVKAERPNTTIDVAKSRVLPGEGFEAELQGKRTWVGSEQLMEKLRKTYGISIDLLRNEGHRLRSDGCSVSFVAQEGHALALGLIGFRDPIKSGTSNAVQRLTSKGIRVVLMTGDHVQAARKIAAQIGITEVCAEVLPNQKADLIASFRASGLAVAMVGDGINDVPALAAADVGFAMSNGTDIAKHSASVILLREDPTLVADTFELARATLSKIKQNLVIAFLYNVLSIPLAAFGFLNPTWAAAAMAISSIAVVVNALLLRRYEYR